MPKQNNKTLKKRERKNKSYKQGGKSEDKPEDYVYSSKFISTQQNTDANYSEEGIIHVTDSTGINAIREMATGFANFFGSKGFDNRVYDLARNNALMKLDEKIDKRNQKVCNLRMEVSHDKTLVFVHLYGTLLQKGVEIVQQEETQTLPIPQDNKEESINGV
jgi:hypothetical protein